MIAISGFRRHMLLQTALLGAVLVAGALMAATGVVPPVFHAFLYLTGIPDPMCGMRTGTLALMKGDLHRAIEANPLSLFFTPFALAMIGDRLYRFRYNRPPRPWVAREKRLLWVGLALVVIGAWIYQLFRFGIF